MKIKLKHLGKKTLASLLCILMMFSTLFIGSISTASAMTVSGGYVYFDASGWNTTTNSNVQIVIGKSDYSSTYTMTKLSGTSLYYYSMPKWDGATYVAFIATPSKWGDGKWGSSNLSKAPCYTGTTSYNLYSGSTYLFTKASSSKGATITGNYYSSGYSALNHTQTTTAQISTNNGTSYSNATSSPAAISISSYKISSNGNSTLSSSSITKGSATVTNTAVSAARTASVTYSVSNVNTNYKFMGWYNSSGSVLSSNTSYTRTGITSTNTVYARFIRLVTITVKAGTGGTITTPSSGSYTGVNAGSSNNITAKANEGYKFSNWTVTTGTATVASPNSASTTVKAQTDSTVTANFVKNSHSITYTPGENFTYGTSNPTEGTYGETVQFTVTPDENYAISVTAKDASNNDVTVTKGIGTNYSFVMPDSAVTVNVVATETNVNYTVTFGDPENGSLTARSSLGTVTSGSEVKAGTSITFTATPDKGYEVEGWYTDADCKDKLTTSTDTTYSVSLTEAISVYVKFVPITPVFSAQCVKGTINEGDSVTVSPQESVTFTVNNADSYPSDASFVLYNGENKVAEFSGSTTTILASTLTSGSYSLEVSFTNGTKVKTAGVMDISVSTVYKITNPSTDNAIVTITYQDAYGDTKTLSEGHSGYALEESTVTVRVTNITTDYELKSITDGKTTKTSSPATFTVTADATYTVTISQIDYIYFYAALQSTWGSDPYVQIGSMVVSPSTTAYYMGSIGDDKALYKSLSTTTGSTALISNNNTFRVRVFKVPASWGGRAVSVGNNDYKQSTGSTLYLEDGYLYYCHADGGNAGGVLAPMSVSSVTTNKTSYSTSESVTISGTVKSYYSNTTAGRDTYKYTYTLNNVDTGTSKVIRSLTAGPVSSLSYNVAEAGTYTVTLTTQDTKTGKMLSSKTSSQFEVNAPLPDLPNPVITGNGATSGVSVAKGSPLLVSISNFADYPENTKFNFKLDGTAKDDFTNGYSIDTNDLELGTHTITVQATCSGYNSSKTVTFTFTVSTVKHNVTVSSANKGVSQLTVAYTKDGKATTITFDNTTADNIVAADENTGLTVTAVLSKDADGVDSAFIKKWVVDGADVEETASTYSYASVTDDASIKVYANAVIKVDDYTIGNTWVKPGEQNNVTIVMKKSHDQLGLSSTYKAQAYVYDSQNQNIFTSDFSEAVSEDNLAQKVTFSPVDITLNDLGEYRVEVAIFGYDAEGNEIAYGELADADRTFTVSNDPAKVTLTARLSAQTDAGVNLSEGASGNLIQGENVTLNGYCNNGNKPAGEYGENTVTEYNYKYYYYTDNPEEPTLIDEVTDNNVNLAGKPVTQTTVTYTVPESDTPGKVYHFYVEITAIKDGAPISDPCSSLSRGAITGTVVEPKVVTPTWAKSPYVFFHTIGDNISDGEAWTAMEVSTTTNGEDSTISVGTYSASSTYRVFLPETAVNTSEKNKNTYLVYNNRSAAVKFTNGTTTVTVPSKETAYIPADVNGFYYTSTATKRTLTVYTSNAEENVYVNANDLTQDANGNSIANVGQFISALSFDGSASTKAGAVVTKPSITLVQSNGKIDTSEVSKQIKGRGNTTWTGTKKKSFNFTLTEKAKVGGMSKGKKYSLLANYQDPSLSRCRFLLDLADSVGVPYSSDSRFTDFYVDGLYVGSYLLTEKYDAIESDLVDDPTEPGAITFDGSGNVTDMDFMIELACNSQGDDLEIKPFTGGDANGILSVVLPDPGDIDDAIAAGTLSSTAKSAITKFIKEKYEALYTALNSSSTTRTQLDALIDVDSLAKVYLINEIAKNYDSGVSSFYLSYVDGKFKASPVWDFDNSLGNPNASPAEAPDYKQPSGWWCKYWKGNSDKYTKNFIHAAANSSVVMEAAKAAWFGKSAEDTTSFVYNINNFLSSSSTSADLGSNTGLLTKAYYLSVLQKSAENNYKKWKVVPNDWVKGHEDLTMYNLDYSSLLPMVDYSTYKLAEGYLPDSEVFTRTLTKTPNHYTSSAITSSTSRNGGQYEFAADYMISRAAWITYSFMEGDSYYLTGAFNNWTTLEDDDYRLVEIESGSGVYVLRNINRSDICGTDVYFKLNNGSSYIGPAANTDLATTTTYHNRPAYKTTGTVTDRDANASLTATKVPTSWTKVNVYYEPSTKSVWVTQYVADQYTAPTVTLTCAEDGQKVEYNSQVSLVATATGSTVSIDGVKAVEYTSEYSYVFYRMLGDTPNPQNDRFIRTITTTENTCQIDVTIRDVYKYYVVVSPAAVDENKSETTSDVVTINGAVESKSTKIPLYIDFAEAEVSATPVVTTVDNEGTQSEYTLEKLGTSNIYTATVDFDYFEGATGLVYDDFDILKITIGETIIAITDSTQPQAQLLKDAGESRGIWLKANTDTLTTNYEDLNYQVRPNLKISVSDIPQITYKTLSHTTNRIYVTNNKNWSEMHIHYWGGSKTSTWGSLPKMTKAMDNDYGQGIYYYDIPIGTTNVLFNSTAGAGGSQTQNITLSNTFGPGEANSYYISDTTDGSGKYKCEPWDNASGAPVISNYVSDVYLSVGSSVGITPETPVGVTYACTSTSSTIAGVQGGNECVVTGKTAGNTTVKITPTGSNKDSGTAVTVNVHVVDKTQLQNYLGNAEAIISYEDGNSIFTDITYDDLVNAYSEALEIYMNSFVSKDISDAVQLLADAFRDLTFAPTEDEFDLISYTTAKLTIQSDENGTVSEPITNGYVQAAGKAYTVTYAANDGTDEFTFNLTSTASPLLDVYEFSGWKMGDGLISDNVKLTITTPPTEDAVYTATFVNNNQTAVTLVYKFQDYDTSDGVYYYEEDKPTIDAEYRTQILIDNDTLGESAVKEAIEDNANVPTIRSNYFDYSLVVEEENFTYNADDQIASVNLTAEPVNYNLEIQGNNMKGHGTGNYQDLFELDATKFGFNEGDDVYWAIVDGEGNETPVSTSQVYSFRITVDDLKLKVAKRDSNEIVLDGTASATPSHYEFSYSGSTQKLTQNFYIIDYFNGCAYDDDGNAIVGATDVTFLGGGVLYCSVDSEGNYTNNSVGDVLKDKKSMADFIKDRCGDYNTSIKAHTDAETKLGYRFLSAQDETFEDIYRYSESLEAYQYIFAATFTNNPDNAGKMMRLYSYYVYSYNLDGETHYQVSISDGYAEASMYEG